MDPVLALVERSNQRGGRMLSVIDLIDAGTFTPEQVAWLLARIEDGAGWLVGARPGGAGKTTIMSALLAMLPAGETARLTAAGSGWQTSQPGECIVSYELNHGPYEAYIWGEDVRRCAELGRQGCRLVANLHADTVEEAREQIVDMCGASPEGFAAFNIFLPIRVSRSGFECAPCVETIHYAANGQWRELTPPLPHSPRATQIAAFLDDCRRQGRSTVHDVRCAWLDWLAA